MVSVRGRTSTPWTARRRFEVNTVEQSALGHVDLAWMVFGDRRKGSRSCWLTLGQRRDFTEAQRERFLGSRTHVASLIRHSDARRRLADVMVALDADDEGGPSGILLLGPSFRVERASPAARRIVARWYGPFGSQLPQQLSDWLTSPFPREPLRVERDVSGSSSRHRPEAQSSCARSTSPPPRSRRGSARS